MKLFKALLALLTLCIFSANLSAQKLAVKNVKFYQQEDARVVVSYDLIGNSAKKYTVELSLYIPDSKRLIPLMGKTLLGDVGKDIRPGRNKRIGWDLPLDIPEGLHGDNFVFVVDAFLQKGVKKLPLILGGIAAAGSGTVLFLLSLSSNPSQRPAPDLPGPPDLPGSN